MNASRVVPQKVFIPWFTETLGLNMPVWFPCKRLGKNICTIDAQSTELPIDLREVVVRSSRICPMVLQSLPFEARSSLWNGNIITDYTEMLDGQRQVQPMIIYIHVFPFSFCWTPLHVALIHYSLVTPYGDVELGQQWIKLCLAVWRHHAITRTNVY